MKKLFIVTLAILFAFAPALVYQTASAATLDWASAVESFAQGTQKNGDPVIAPRSDPTAALGPNDGTFVSLGFDGELVLEFPVKAGGVLTIQAFEVTGGPYELETAEVLVSDDGISFTSVGTASNELGEEDGVSEFLLDGQCVKYVKLVNTTDPELHTDDADGFDVDAVSMEYEEECPEEPGDCNSCDHGDDYVFNSNDASVRNSVRIKANTGGNFADGSYGGSGGSGGDIEIGAGEGEVEESTTGNGGNGGNASTGGTVITGNATATGSLTNMINENDTEIDRCACQEDCCDEVIDGDCRFIHGDDTMVMNRNRARMQNDMDVKANTGNNEALGSYAGEGGNGGDIEIGGDNHFGGPFVLNNVVNGHDGSEGSVDESTTGTGGIGGEGAEGGLVQTGESRSWAEVVNMVNRNITRIRR